MPAVSEAEKRFVSVCADELRRLPVLLIFIAFVGIKCTKCFAGIVFAAVRAANESSLYAADFHGAFRFCDIPLARFVANLAALAELLCVDLAGLAIRATATHHFL